MSKGYPVLSSSKNGRSVKQGELTTMIVAALPKGQHSLQVPVTILTPKVNESDIGPIVVVKQSSTSCTSTMARSWWTPTRRGRPAQVPDPTGTFEILDKKKDPCVPPKSTGPRT